MLLNDQIAERSIVAGVASGAVLLGAEGGALRFRDVHGDGHLVGYKILAFNGQFEQGLGRLIVGESDLIIRSIPLVSSEAGNGLVTFEPGDKRVVSSVQLAHAAATSHLGHFKAHKQDNETITGNQENVIEFDAEAWDHQNWFDAVTGHRFEPQLPGTYLIVAGAAVSDPPANGEVLLSIRKNGIQVVRNVDIPPTTAQTNVQATTTVALNGNGDAVDVSVRVNAAGSFTMVGSAIETFVTGWRIGPLS